MGHLMSSAKAFSARGLPVDYSFYSDHEPYILNGAFQLDNQAEEPLQFAVRKVWCQVPGQNLPVEHFFVYRLPDFNEEDPATIQQPPHLTTQFEVSFPQISAAPYMRQHIQVGIELVVAGDALAVFSIYRISRRTKRGGELTTTGITGADHGLRK
jgi:hypothetical protein